MMKEGPARKGVFARERRKARALSKDRGITLMQAQDAVARDRGYAHWSDMLERGGSASGDRPAIDPRTFEAAWTPGLELLLPPHLPAAGEERGRHLVAVASIMSGGMRIETDRDGYEIIERLMVVMIERAIAPGGGGPSDLKVDLLQAELDARLSAADQGPKGPDAVVGFMSTLRRDLEEAGHPELVGVTSSHAHRVSVGDMVRARPVRIVAHTGFAAKAADFPSAIWREDMSRSAKGEILRRRVAGAATSVEDLRLLGGVLAQVSVVDSKGVSELLRTVAGMFAGDLSRELGHLSQVLLHPSDLKFLSEAILSDGTSRSFFMDELFPGVADIRRGDGCDPLVAEWILDACSKMDGGRRPFRFDPILGGNLDRAETEAAVATLVRARGVDASAVPVVMDVIDVARNAATRLLDMSEIAGSSHEDSGRRIVLPVVAAIVSRHMGNPEQIAFYARLNRLKDGRGEILKPNVDEDAWSAAWRALSFLRRPVLATALG